MTIFVGILSFHKDIYTQLIWVVVIYEEKGLIYPCSSELLQLL
jgi:hypothetical protein